MSENPEQAPQPSPSEAAIPNVDAYSRLVNSIGEFAKTLYVEQRLPAAVLIIILVSLVIVILASPSESTRLFLWCLTIPLLLILTFFVLPRQGKWIQDIKRDLKKLSKENQTLRESESSLNTKLDAVRDQVTGLANDSYQHLEQVQRSLADIKSRVNEILASQDISISEAKAREIDREVARLVEFINIKKREVDNIRNRIPGAEIVLKSAPQVASFLAKIQKDMEK